MTSDAPLSRDRTPPTRIRRLIRPLGIILWVAVLALAGLKVARDPSAGNLSLFAVFAILCLAVNAQLWFQSASGRQRWQHMSARLGNGAYIDDAVGLPNRNYLLTEIRREIARSQTSGVPFTLVHLSLHDFAGVRKRRGDDFADRAVRSLSGSLRRLTNDSDFLAHLDTASFAVLLIGASRADARAFLRAVPGWLSVSDGEDMLDMAIVARVQEYDLESVYATDVIRQLEESEPLMREQHPMATVA